LPETNWNCLKLFGIIRNYLTLASFSLAFLESIWHCQKLSGIA